MSTLLDFVGWIKEDLDLDTPDGEHPFISTDQIKRHVRYSARKAASIIHNLYEDYYLKVAYLPIVAGTQSYSLPTGIYANKIRRIIYDDGSTSYRIDRIQDINEIAPITENEDYRYIILNDTEPKITIYPAPRETSATSIKIYFIRETKQLLLDTDECDIPEFDDFILAEAKYRCLFKDFANPIRADLKEEAIEQRQLMIASLTNRQPDDQTLMKADFSHYEESNA